MISSIPKVRIIKYLDHWGKTILNWVEDASKYLLAFPEAHYLFNSQNYDPLKFYVILHMSLVTIMLKFAQ